MVGIALPLRKVGRGSCSSEITDGPGYITEEWGGCLRVNQGEQWLDDTIVDDKITHNGPITCDITECPYSLLANILVWASQQLHKMWDSTAVHDSLGLVRSSRCDIGQSPCGLKL